MASGSFDLITPRAHLGTAPTAKEEVTVQWAARTVSVRLRDYDFRTRQRSRTLPDPVVSDRVVASVAKELLTELRQRRQVPARLVGVTLSQLTHQDSVDQLSLFGAPTLESDRDRALARAVDQVREKFGRGALGRGD